MIRTLTFIIQISRDIKRGTRVKEKDRENPLLGNDAITMYNFYHILGYTVYLRLMSCSMLIQSLPNEQNLHNGATSQMS